MHKVKLKIVGGIVFALAMMVTMPGVGQAAIKEVVQPISANRHDAEEDLTYHYTIAQSRVLELGEGAFFRSSQQLVGLLFDKLEIPEDGVLKSAHIEFTAARNNSGAASYTIALEDTVTPEQYTYRKAPIDGRTLVSETIDWSNVEAWQRNNTYRTPDLTDHVKQLLERSEWNEQSGISFIISGTGLRSAQASEAGKNNGPRLVMEFEVPDVVPDPDPDPTPTDTQIHVSISFDDGLLSTFERGLPLMEEYGLRGTVYVNTVAPNNGWSGYMNWGQLMELEDVYGWEVSNHSYSHAYLTTLSDIELAEEIGRARDDLLAHNITPRGLASPYGDYDDRVIDAILKDHEYHRTAYGYTFNEQPFNERKLAAVEISHDKTPAEIIALIDQAVAQDKWLVLFLHELVSGPATPYTYNENDFETILEYLQEKNISVGTVYEGLHQKVIEPEPPVPVDNLVLNGDFEQGTDPEADHWTRSNNAVDIMTFPPDPKYGSRLAYFAGGNELSQLLTDAVYVKDSKAYTLKADWYVENHSSGSGNIWINEFNSNGDYIGGQYGGGVYGPSGITSHSFSYQPLAGTAYIQIAFYTMPGSQMDWYLDNVVLAE